MIIRKIIKMAMITALALANVTCKSNKAVTMDPLAVLAYEKSHSQEDLENLSKAYGTVINKNRKSDKREPGLYADYAVTLALLGKASEANIWFNNEMETFPASKKYVMQLKKELIPEYLNNKESNIGAQADEEQDNPSDDEGKAATKGNKKKNKK